MFYYKYIIYKDWRKNEFDSNKPRFSKCNCKTTNNPNSNAISFSPPPSNTVDSFENSTKKTKELSPKEKTGFIQKIKNLSKKQKAILALSAVATTAIIAGSALLYLRSAKHAEFQGNRILEKSKKVFNDIQAQITETLETIEKGKQNNFEEFENKKGNIVKFIQGDEDHHDVIKEYTKNGKLLKEITARSDDGTFDSKDFDIVIHKNKGFKDEISYLDSEEFDQYIEYTKNIKEKDNYKTYKECFQYGDNLLNTYCKNTNLFKNPTTDDRKAKIGILCVCSDNKLGLYAKNITDALSDDIKIKQGFERDTKTGKLVKANLNDSVDI